MPKAKIKGETKEIIKPQNEAKITEIELVPNLNAKLGRVYSNFVQVSHSPWDFTLRFCDAPPGGDIPRLNKKGNKIEIPTEVEVVIPASLISDLIRILNEQNKKFMENIKKANSDEKNQ